MPEEPGGRDPDPGARDEPNKCLPETPSPPELAVLMAEECRRFLVRLDLRLKDPDLRALAVDNMIGYTDREIARRRGCSVRTVERRLKLIRKMLREGHDHGI